MSQNDVEVWKNTSAGLRWVSVTTRQGFQDSRMVRGGKVFTITPFDRQVNQGEAATTELDMFRNGTFVLVKAAHDTDKQEIESADSLTDSEILGIIHEVMAKNVSMEQAISRINSPIALQRIKERLVIEDAKKSMIDVVSAKKAKVEPGAPLVERVQVAPPQKEEEVVTPRGGIPEAETPDVIKTEPEKV